MVHTFLLWNKILRNLKIKKKEKNCRQFRLLVHKHPIRNERMGKEGVRGELLLLPATGFILIEYVIIWCMIKVILNPLG